MRGLTGCPVLVTGAASGIGRATAERLATEGAAVALVDRDADALATVADAISQRGARAIPIVADVSCEDDVRNAIECAVAGLGGLRGLVTSAGIFDPGDFTLLADVSLATFAHVISVNLTGTFLFAKYALPRLLQASSAGSAAAIVTIASTAGLRGHGFGSGYTASKGGVVALTRLLAFQYGPQGVRANCVCPGLTDTPMTGGAYKDPEIARTVTRHSAAPNRAAGRNRQPRLLLAQRRRVVRQRPDRRCRWRRDGDVSGARWGKVLRACVPRSASAHVGARIRDSMMRDRMRLRCVWRPAVAAAYVLALVAPVRGIPLTVPEDIQQGVHGIQDAWKEKRVEDAERMADVVTNRVHDWIAQSLRTASIIAVVETLKLVLPVALDQMQPRWKYDNPWHEVKDPIAMNVVSWQVGMRGRGCVDRSCVPIIARVKQALCRVPHRLR